MTTCPKCGSKNIIGPKFVQNMFGQALRYECAQCGYVTHGKTVEQEQRERDEVEAEQR